MQHKQPSCRFLRLGASSKERPAAPAPARLEIPSQPPAGAARRWRAPHRHRRAPHGARKRPRPAPAPARPPRWHRTSRLRSRPHQLGWPSAGPTTTITSACSSTCCGTGSRSSGPSSTRSSRRTPRTARLCRRPPSFSRTPRSRCRKRGRSTRGARKRRLHRRPQRRRTDLRRQPRRTGGTATATRPATARGHRPRRRG